MWPWLIIIITVVLIGWLGSRGEDDGSVDLGARWRLLDSWYWGEWFCLAVIAGITATAFLLLRLEV